MPMLPWLTSPVMLHSSRDPGECTMTPEQCAYKHRYWVFWYEADHRYSLPTVAFFLVAIMLFTMARLIRLFTPRSWKRLSGWARLMAVFRTLSYKKLWILGSSTQSIGALFLAAVGVVYFLAMTLAPRPYYWPNTMEINYGNSPPIATRSGFMALACMPFIYMLAAKASPITLLTGISHELLTNWHSWAAWAMFVLALVHTFPFIVYHIQMGDIVEQWNDGGLWVTGVVALLAQAWLTFGSIPWLRNRYYEFFKSTHFIAALVFIVFFFFHCDYTLSSWDYFIATAVLYTLSWCYSQCKTYFEYGVGHEARLQRESNGTLKITINSRKARWTVGQHIYLRFLAGGIMHVLTAHPFTICSMPHTDPAEKASQLVFYIRPRGGDTKFLMAQAIKHPNTEIPVLMDGPYGGIPSTQLNFSDSALAVGGGAGAGFTLAVIEHILQRHADMVY
ncbi:ferric reductase transmembrane component, putative [Talaromyces stipitatus ATCC 10500]|uniref:ferric-chelate reductase (NADPH) n=1 Tax=Talaromyces stipitatus (strain ATCC 10500 / CBS 375.48 / QM 6759 / NRRL 1006) TaxID=441959 RepID=B8M981_TALSN|nr:ferric reductase transmembrane component, putative [Talaromyces stipitatus ATCC 10500]EED17376.1 ferric reductase transmembrane component, putative [Talaromyces stipitatus ATCC 10500]